MDYFIVALLTISALYFHWWLYRRVKRWGERDLALSMAGQDAAKKAYMLEQLEQARHNGIQRDELQGWLERAAENYRGR